MNDFKRGTVGALLVFAFFATTKALRLVGIRLLLKVVGSVAGSLMTSRPGSDILVGRCHYDQIKIAKCL